MLNSPTGVETAVSKLNSSKDHLKINIYTEHGQRPCFCGMVDADSASSKLAQSLHSIPGFMPLAREPKNLDDLTKGTILQKFGAGEKVIRQGQLGNALYIIIAGEAKVTVMNKLGMELEVMTIWRGEFFGKMALF